MTSEVSVVDDVTYEAPGSIGELLDILDGGKATIMAGATDIMPKVNDGVLRPSRLVYIGKAGLDGIRKEKGRLILGAATKLSDLLESELVNGYAPLLAEAIANMAGVSIRNIATIGGNLCNASPAADTAVPLLVMDAKFVLLSRKGKRTVPADSFFTGPGKTVLSAGEILSEIILEIGPHRGAVIKIGQRKAETLSVVSAAARVVVEDGKCAVARIAMGSVAPRPLRCYKAEELLAGQPISGELCGRAAALAGEYATPIDDGRATAWYRKRVAPVLVERVLRRSFGLEEGNDREVSD
jgi:carbon-monoxide dehydrogenase medium subunit